eukprot:gene2765-109_t
MLGMMMLMEMGKRKPKAAAKRLGKVQRKAKAKVKAKVKNQCGMTPIPKRGARKPVKRRAKTAKTSGSKMQGKAKSNSWQLVIRKQESFEGADWDCGIFPDVDKVIKRGQYPSKEAAQRAVED